jgi:glucose-6-phosphate dehydrogenase assembly protein OpcA
LWSDLGQQDPNGVLRACTMTLIVVAEEKRDPQTIGETIAKLIHEHPSRAIVVRVRDCVEAVLTADVRAQCWMPFGSRQQICCEQVEILASPSQLADATAVIRALTVPDLPVVLYCPSESLWGLSDFRTLLDLPHKYIVDSTGMPDSLQALGYLSAQRTRVADLTWARLTPWREAVAQIFARREHQQFVYKLSEIRMMHSAQQGETAGVYYMAGWFMHVLGAGVPIKIAPGAGPSYAGIVQIEMIADGFKAAIELMEPSTCETRVNNEHLQITMFPELGEYEALRQELTIVGRDATFEDALGLANLMYSGGAR